MLFVVCLCILTASADCVDDSDMSIGECDANRSHLLDERYVSIFNRRRHSLQMEKEYSRVDVYCKFNWLFGCIRHACDRCEIVKEEGKRCGFSSSRYKVLVKGRDGYVFLWRTCDPRYAIAIGVVVGVLVLALLGFGLYVYFFRKEAYESSPGGDGDGYIKEENI